jgi:hypothetical protein
LLEVLESKGFGQKWRDWIACLLLTASTMIIVNGELTEPIFHKRGLREGDPLSPLLFFIASDILAEIFAMANVVGALKMNRFLLIILVGHGILICLPFLKPFVLPRAKRANGNSVNNAKEEEKKRDSLGV